MTLLWRSIKGLVQSQRVLYALTAAGVALGVASVVSIQIINKNAVASFSASVKAVSLGAGVIVRAGARPLDERVYAEVLADPAVVGASPVHRVEVAFFPDADRKMYLDVLGVDLSAPGRLPLNGAPNSLGEILGTRGWSAVTPELADELGFEPGTRFEVVAGTRSVELVMGAEIDFRRIAPLSSSRLVLMDIAQSQDFFAERGIIDEINVFVEEGAPREDVASRLAEQLAGRAIVTTPGQRNAEARGLLGAFELNLTALSFISLLVGLFLVYTSVQASLVRRRRELGVLRAMGATQRQVLRLLLVEASVVGVIGTVAGVPLGYLGASLNVDAVSGTLRDIYLLNAIERLEVPGWIYLLAVGLGIGGAVAGALLPSLEAVRREPRELLGRAAANDSAIRLAPKLAVGGACVGLAALGWYLAVGATVDYGGFVLAVALVLLIPSLAPLALQLAARSAPAHTLGGGYAVRTLQSGRASASALTVAALGIAFSMLISITLMIGSFRATLEVWIDRVVIADVYVSTATSDHGGRSGGFAPNVVSQVQATPGVGFLDTIRRREGTANDRPVRIVGVNLSLPGTVERFPLLDGAYAGLQDKLLTGNSVLITEPFARKSNTWTGDSLDIETPDGKRTVTVGAVFFDYSTEKGVVYTHRDLYADLFGPGQPVGLALYLDDSADPEAMVGTLNEELQIPGLVIQSNKTLRSRVFEIFEQTFAIVRLLQGMSLLIAAFGITLTLFVIARERVAELALYRALGATRRQVFRFFVGKGAALGGLGCGLGLVGGAALAWVLVFVINRELFGWTIQVFIPWAALAEQIVTVVLVALAAAAIPALRASQTPAGELTRDAL